MISIMIVRQKNVNKDSLILAMLLGNKKIRDDGDEMFLTFFLNCLSIYVFFFRSRILLFLLSLQIVPCAILN